MDEMVIVNLWFVLLPSPALTIPSTALTIPSPALTIPFPPVNKFPNKLAPNVPSNILKNPPLCSLVSFSIVLVTPFNKIPEFSNASIIFIISFISSCSIINLTLEPCIFFFSIADIAAVKPNSANTFLANGIATFINGPTNLINNLPKNPSDCINFFIWTLLNFISVAKLLLIAFLSLVFCLVVNNNSRGSSSLLKFLIPNLNVAPSLDLTAFLIYLIVHLLIYSLF